MKYKRTNSQFEVSENIPTASYIREHYKSYWDKLMLPLTEKKIYYTEVDGNVGDELINLSTRELFKQYGCILTDFEKSDIIICSGGGNTGNLYGRPERKRNGLFKRKGNKEMIIFPQSLYGETKTDKSIKIYAREQTSFEALKRMKYNTELVPDIALSYVPKIKGTFEFDEGVFIRKDKESNSKRIGPDPIKLVNTPIEYLELAGKYKKVISDRLHFVISALLMGVPDITIIGNSYHKNISMWETWLKDWGVKYKEA